MHQEKSFPGRVSGTTITNPDFAAVARAFGGWSERVDETAQFAPALRAAAGRKGVRLIHLATDIEVLAANGLTLSALRNPS
jgi:acetolactate synthase-1/2/3 large subunit